MNTKNVPLALFSAFCLKALITGVSNETVACLGVLGLIAFLYEKFIQDNAIINLSKALEETKKNDEAAKKELEQIKAYVSSLKLNGIRGPNGINRTA